MSNEQTTSLTKEERNLPAMQDQSDLGSIGGLEGADAEDIMLPLCKIVQSNSTGVDLANGGRAKEGKLFFSNSQKQVDSVKVIILFAKKGQQADVETDEVHSNWRVLMTPVDSLNTPFVMYFSKTANWNGWKPFINKLKPNGVNNLWDVVVEITAKQESNKKGQQYFIPVLTIGERTTDEQKDLAAAVLARFGDMRDEDDAMKEASEAVITEAMNAEEFVDFSAIEEDFSKEKESKTTTGK